MTKTSKAVLVLVGALFLGGCMGAEEPTSAEFARLSVCSPTLEEGADCDDGAFACVRDDGTTAEGDADGAVCRCEATAADEAGATGRGVVVCDREPPPGTGGGGCGDAATGGHCDPTTTDDACVDPSGSLRCRCVPSSDAADCGYFWLCEDDSPPTPEPRCDDAALDHCFATGSGGCVAEDGIYCVCDVGADGEMRLRCDGGGGDPTDPDRCTAEHYARCDSGEYVECIGEEGGRCWCGTDASGADPGDRGGMVCEPWPGPPSTGGEPCTDEHHDRCADASLAGADGGVHCISAEGRDCFCDAAADGRGALVCR